MDVDLIEARKGMQYSVCKCSIVLSMTACSLTDHTSSTTVKISPSSLCPTSSDGLFKEPDKRIDAASGLDLPREKRNILVLGVYFDHETPSINQTASFVNFVPTNLDVKMPLSNKDPLIQLGTWIAAEFEKREKRKREGYKLHMV